MEIKAQPLHERNIADVLRIQKTAYPDNYLEDADSFLAKIVASPSTSFGAWQGDAMVGYLIALARSTDDGLGFNILDVPSVPINEARVMYIHDVAVHPDARGLGVADLLLENLQHVVSDTSISEWRLVSVQGSRGFWEKRGFEVGSDPLPNGYGPEAVLMLRA